MPLREVLHNQNVVPMEAANFLFSKYRYAKEANTATTTNDTVAPTPTLIEVVFVTLGDWFESSTGPGLSSAGGRRRLICYS